ncbi:MAG: nitroreductase [Pseudomonadota bacterium]
MPDIAETPSAPPTIGESLAAAHPSEETLRFLSRRRSLVVKEMAEPGPTADELSALLRIAARVPDHGKLAPWRFLVIEGDARAELGEMLKAAFTEQNPNAPADLVEFERRRFLRAPTVVCVVSTADPLHPKIPEWEQILSAGAVCQTLLLAASAMGFAGQWLTEWYAYDATALKALGLAEGERVAGFVYLGKAGAAPAERVRPDMDALISRWGGAR